MGMETFVDVYTTDSSCSQQVLNLPFSQRKCILTSDLPGFVERGDKYRQPACMLRCYRAMVHNVCRCHPYQLPIDPFVRIRGCGIMDVPCFVDNYCEYSFKNIL